MFKKIFNKVFKRDSHYSQPSLDLFKKLFTGQEYGDNFFLYENNGIAKKIVDCVVDDGMRQWIECDESLLAELIRLEVREKFMDAGKLARLRGGAIVLLMIDDGQSFDKELKYDASNQISYINKICSLQVHGMEDVSFKHDSIITDPFHKDFSLPAILEIKTLTDVNGLTMTVHRSRCIFFRGDVNYTTKSVESKIFGVPVLKKVTSSLSKFLESLDAGLATQRDFVQAIFKVDGLVNQLESEDGVAGFSKRLEALALLKSHGNKNIMPIDASEEYLKHSSSVGGFADITDRLAECLSASSGIPIAKLFGRTSGGLNSTGDSDMQQYYDLVRSWRNDQLQKSINYMISLVYAQESFKKPENSAWEFPSLTAPTEKEQAEIRKIYTEIDWGYIDRNIIDGGGSYKERWGHGKFHENIKVKPISNEELEADIADTDLSVDKNQVKEELKQKELERKLKDAENNLR
jgi:phage-related protein (TIGR01555 family)